MSLPRPYRLNLRFHRQRLLQQGTTRQTPLFTFIFQTNQLSHSRYAILLSRKFSPLAVTRNHFKRIITNTIQKNLSSLPTQLDILIIPKKKTLSLSSSKLSSSLITSLNHLHPAHETKKSSPKSH